MYLLKKCISSAQWGLGQSKPQKLGDFIRLLLTVSYSKLGQQDVLLAHPIVLLGEQLRGAVATPPCSAHFLHLWFECVNINKISK